MKIDAIERSKSARLLFENGLNCAQAVAVAFADVVGIEPSILERVALAFGGGLGRQREVCGTVSGASMVLGVVEANAKGDAKGDAKNDAKNDAKKRAYVTVQDFSAKFRAHNGSIICRELLSLAKGENSDPEPTPRSENYYRRRPCADYVEFAALEVARAINGE